ncbi:hypothetical protein ACFL6G_00355 [candidate division KSB1 bacterium]
MNKKLGFLIPVLMIAIIISIPQDAFCQKVDYSKIVGVWVMAMPGRQGETRDVEWTFSMKEDKLILAMPARGGRGGGGGGEPTVVEEIEFDGEKMTFEITRTMRDREMTTEYELVFKGDAVEGVMVMGERGEREFTGKKKK